jgi:hypothetical protein
MCRVLLAGFLLLACSTALANESNTILPGMDLATAKAILEKYDYKYGARYGLAMARRDRDHALEFARIDTDTTLVLDFFESTQAVASLGVEIIPDLAPKLNRRQVSLDILAISFDSDGTYTLKLKRKAGSQAKPE